MIPPDPPSHFEEPWQAEAFALTVALADAGLFSWADWSRALAAAIADLEARGETREAAGYSRAWLAALEVLTVERGAIERRAIDLRAEAWREAYAHTPHGRPVVLGGGAAG